MLYLINPKIIWSTTFLTILQLRFSALHCILVCSMKLKCIYNDDGKISHNSSENKAIA